MPEIDVAGSIPMVDEGVYAFGYQDAEDQRPALHVKCMTVPASQGQGNALLVQWAVIEHSSEVKAQSVLELITAEYTTKESSAVPQALKNMEQFVSKLDNAFGQAIGISRGISASVRNTEEVGPQETGQVEGSGRSAVRSQGSWPLQEPPLPPGVLPSTVGYEDVVPPGLRPPGMVGGGMREGPLHPGGGMLVGPDHPIFGPGRLQGPSSRDDRGSALPPGARWDPIGPPGTRGFLPEGGRRPDGEHPHPDLAQPGPGRGTDWTSFYG